MEPQEHRVHVETEDHQDHQEQQDLQDSLVRMEDRDHQEI